MKATDFICLFAFSLWQYHSFCSLWKILLHIRVSEKILILPMVLTSAVPGSFSGVKLDRHYCKTYYNTIKGNTDSQKIS